MDYYFYDVNDDMATVPPNQSMHFGRVFHRILYVTLEANPRFGPVYMCKIDIADDFYRVWLHPAETPKLGIVLPTRDGEEPLSGPPLVLPMGWVNYPYFFCLTIETICDLANANANIKS
jgi:hypothetical protein